jgi:hypothetical protein
VKVTGEGPTRITKATIEAAWRRRAPGLRLIVRDAGCRGLALIVNPTSMSWSYAYRPRGTDPRTGRRWPNRTVTIGNPASHSAEDARAEANRNKGEAAAGRDPAQERRAKAEAERRRQDSELGRLLDEYARVLPGRPKIRGAGSVLTPDYVSDELTNVRAALTEMQAEDMPATALTVAEVRQWLEPCLGDRPAPDSVPCRDFSIGVTTLGVSLPIHAQ